jgi:hypothetical protein
MSAEEGAIDLHLRLESGILVMYKQLQEVRSKSVEHEVPILSISSYTVVGKCALLFLSGVSGIIMVRRDTYVFRNMKVVGELDMAISAMRYIVGI